MVITRLTGAVFALIGFMLLLLRHRIDDHGRLRRYGSSDNSRSSPLQGRVNTLLSWVVPLGLILVGLSWVVTGEAES